MRPDRYRPKFTRPELPFVQALYNRRAASGGPGDLYVPPVVRTEAPKVLPEPVVQDAWAIFADIQRKKDEWKASHQ